MTDSENETGDGKIVVVVDEDLRDLIPGYLEHRRKDITDLLAALDQDDFETIRSIGHKMKGSGGGYGFDGITDIGRIIEEAAKSSQAPEIREQVASLQTYLDHVEVVFNP